MHSGSTAAKTQTGSDVLWGVVAGLAPPLDSLVAQVYETLWKQIVGGERQPEQRLLDGELAAELGVSRTPVRQALLQLQQAGLVAATPNRGFHVASASAEDLRELYDLRAILENAAVRQAAARIPAAQLGAALDTIDALRALPEAEAGADFVRSDVELHHQLIAAYCGNRRLAEAIAAQHARLSVYVLGGTRVPGGIGRALDEHEAIVRALLARDTAQAAAKLADHLTRVRDDAIRLLDSRPVVRPRRLRG